MNEAGVAFLLIGGMNFLLRHEPVLTFDIDLWIDDTEGNRRNCEAALAALDAEWGDSDTTWQRTSQLPAGWLSRQGMFSLHTPHGAIDIFRQVRGLPSWSESRKNAIAERTSSGVSYYGICDNDMLQCQLALEEGSRKIARIAALEREIKNAKPA